MVQEKFHEVKYISFIYTRLRTFFIFMRSRVFFLFHEFAPLKKAIYAITQP